MLKFKRPIPKSSIHIGAYFEYTGQPINDIRLYKLVHIEDGYVTFAWYDKTKKKVDYSPNWRRISDLQGYLDRGLYKVISENKVDQILKDFNYVQNKKKGN